MRLSKNVGLSEALGLELRLCRTELGLSQDTLAVRCNLDRAYISRLEAGKNQPSLSIVLLLAEGMGFTLTSFVGRVEDRYSRVKLGASGLKDVNSGATHP